VAVSQQHSPAYAKFGKMLRNEGRNLDNLPAFEREVLFSIFQKLLNAPVPGLGEDHAQTCMGLLLHAWDNSIRLNGGRPESWAAGLVHVASKYGWGQDFSCPRLRQGEISRMFGVSSMTVCNQSKKILHYLNARSFSD